MLIIIGDNDMPHNLKHFSSLCHMQHDIATSLVKYEIQTTTHDSTKIRTMTLIVPVKTKRENLFCGEIFRVFG